MSDNPQPDSVNPPSIPHDARYGWNGSANAQAANLRAAWWHEPLRPINEVVYVGLLMLAIIGIIASIGDRRGDELWGYFPLFLSAVLYSGWMTLMILIRPSATTGENWARWGYASVVAPLVIAIPTSVAFAIIYFAADLSSLRDRHYFWGEGLSSVVLMPIASWFAGAATAVTVGLIVAILLMLKQRHATQRQALEQQFAASARAVFAGGQGQAAADASAPPTPAGPLLAPERFARAQRPGTLTWRQEFLSLLTTANIVAFFVLFGIMAAGTYINIGAPWSGWGIVSYPFPVMLFSMWLVLEGIWRSPDRLKLGKRVTFAAFIVPLVFTLLQVLIAFVSARVHPAPVRRGSATRFLPLETEPVVFVIMGVLFAAALALATWIISGGATALLRAWARRYPISQTQPRLIRRSTALIGVSLTPFAAGWLLHALLEREFGITWRMLRAALGSGMPEIAPFLVIWVTIIVLLYGGGALLVTGIALGLFAIRRRYVTALAAVTPVPLPATAEATPPEIPANFVEPEPGGEPHPDSPLGEYLANVQYDGGDPLPAPRPKRGRLMLPGRRARRSGQDLDSLEQ